MASIFFAGIIDGRDVLFIYGDASQEHEIALSLTGHSFRKAYNTSSFRAMPMPNTIITIFSFPTGTQDLVTVYDSDPQFDYDSLHNFCSLGTNQSVLVGRPYLVCWASISGTELAFKGDLNASTPLTIISPAAISSITWNGAALSVHTSSSLMAIGGLVGELTLSSAFADIAVAPRLEGWKFRDSLPEIRPTFDDGSFVVVNHTTTNIPLKPYYSNGTILYGCDYGFSTNNRNTIEETDDAPFYGVTMSVITVVQDDMGLNETSGTNPDSSKSPRGICGFQLNSGMFTQWQVQGKIGRYTEPHGMFNKEGLYGEHKGWHLPGFDTSSWESTDLNHGLPRSAAGIGFFVMTFDLHIPEGLDMPMSFNFNEPLGQPYWAYLFVNGWMMGKRVGNLGPQAKLPVHQGILDYSGTNIVAVGLWSMEANASITPDLQLSVDAVYSTRVDQEA
ncbi:galactose-binding domain-like protein [Armillaria fumosa]|nr:galactose-binding domain-like protein [Armillaria fumosa]